MKNNYTIMKGEDKKEKEENNPRIIKVIIETPQGSRNKYVWNKDLKLIELKDNLPLGVHFPFDFGFIPDTIAQDKDPIDVMVLCDTPSHPANVISCKVIGIIKAEMQEKNGETVENDRIIAVPIQKTAFSEINSLKEVDKELIKQLLAFFIFYEKQLGKKFTPLKIGGPSAAMDVINASLEDVSIANINKTPFQVKAEKE